MKTQSDMMIGRYGFRGHEVLTIEKVNGERKYRIDDSYAEYENEREAREAINEILANS
jgi:hypothetical protein